jgi:uncharacterized membrane protein
MYRVIALGLAVYSFVVIDRNIPRLPARIPTHFNSAGNPNAWGSPDSLWLLLVIQVLGTGLLLTIPHLGRRYPRAVNLGLRKLSDFPPAARERIMPLLEDMCGAMGLLFSFLFAALIHETIRVATSPGARLAPWLIWLFLGGNALTLFYYLRRINCEAKENSRPDSPTPLP